MDMRQLESSHWASSIALERMEKAHRELHAMDEFKSTLIVAYERALQSGLRPSVVLAALLDWASSELERSLGARFGK